MLNAKTEMASREMVRKCSTFNFSISILWSYSDMIYFFALGFSEDGDDAPAALSSAAASSYQLWLDIATKNIPLPLATKDYVRRNPLREALIANSMVLHKKKSGI